MRVLCISRNNLELAEADLDREIITIGRSPACDVVLRAPGVKPVHYLMEWVGEGTFNRDSGYWMVFDVSGTHGLSDQNVIETAIGEGSIIGPKKTFIGDLTFYERKDSLRATSIQGNILLNQNEPAPSKDFYAQKNWSNLLIEVLTVFRKTEAVVDIEHFPVSPRWNRVHSRQWPAFRLKHKTGEDHGIIDWKDPALASKFEVRGSGHQLPGKILKIRRGDFFLVVGVEETLLIRLVPKINIPRTPRAFFKDPLVRIGAPITLGVGMILLLLLSGQDPRDLEKPKEPPRVAKVEIKAPPPPPPPPAQEPIAPVRGEKGLSPGGNQKKEKPSRRPVPKPDKPSAAAPPPPVPKPKDVSKLGILGMLNRSKQEVVSAEKVQGALAQQNSKTGVKVATGVQSDVTVLKGDQKNGPQSASLESVSKGVQKSGVYGSGHTPGALGDGSGLSAGSGIGGSGGGDGLGGDGIGTGGQLEVSGGLDRETVKRVINSYRRQIRSCFESALRTRPDLTGRIAYQWVISETGPVLSVKMQSSDVNEKRFEGCVQEVIRTMKFPKAPNGGRTVVIYPFEFQSH